MVVLGLVRTCTFLSDCTLAGDRIESRCEREDRIESPGSGRRIGEVLIELGARLGEFNGSDESIFLKKKVFFSIY